jgi:glycosyltransferase involved in cell wall biosynthesis
MGMKAPILVITVPIAAGVIGQLGESQSIYYRVDDFTLWPGYAARAIRQLERGRLLPRASALMFSADALDVADFSGPRLRLDHGVELSHFSARGERPPGVPSTAFALFAGRVDERLDRRLLEASPIPVVVLGDDRGLPLPAAVSKHPPVPYSQLPDWLHAAAVLLLPYGRSALTDTIQPLKLREYLATGRPIASTRMPEVERICGDLVEYGDSPDAFGDAIGRALREGRKGPKRRRAVVEGDDWAGRAALFCSFIEGL